MSTITATPKNTTIDAADSGSFLLGGDMKINRLGFGAMRITGEGVWGEPKDPAEAKRVLLRALDLGINFIDTADSYGPEVSERIIAETLHPYRDGLIVATKGGFVRPGPGKWNFNGDPAYLEQCVHDSLRRLKVERIDLWQMHRIDANIPVEQSLEPLVKLQQQGKIRHFGLSEAKPDQIEQVRQHIPVVSVQNQYNIGDRQHEDALRYCQKHNIAFIPWYPVAAGKLAQPGGPLDKAAKRHGASVAQIAIAWLLHRSRVMLPIPGTSSVKHLEENTASASLRLSDNEWTDIETEVARIQ